jgi:hypothetical protein
MSVDPPGEGWMTTHLLILVDRRGEAQAVISGSLWMEKPLSPTPRPGSLVPAEEVRSKQLPTQGSGVGAAAQDFRPAESMQGPPSPAAQW